MRAVHFSLTVAALLLCLMPMAHGADGGPTAGAGWDVFATVYTIFGSAVLGGLGWLAQRVVKLINTKIANEILRGVLARLTTSVYDAVAMVNQTVKPEILAAKDPNGPGGTKFTQFEREQMLDKVWDALTAEYGGWDGIVKLVGKIGVGTRQAAHQKISTMIESAVRGQKQERPRPA